MRQSCHPLPVESTRALLWWVFTIALVTVTLTQPAALTAQAHEHGDGLSTRDARLELMLGGPHLILYHRGYLALGDEQIASLQRLRRSVCDAEFVYVEQTRAWRDRLGDLLSDSAPLAPRQPKETGKPPDAITSSRFHEATSALALAESQWLTELMHARREALALLTSSQRAQAATLRDHWTRETGLMIEQATRPGQRGHPGTQIPIRVPGMVVNETTLLPHCEALHGPSRHIVIPPPR